MKKIKVWVMVGSDSDLKQCKKGFAFLKEWADKDMVDVEHIIINSIHRNTKEVFKNLELAVIAGVDVIIAGAGWANYLTGTIDAYLRYTMRNDHIVVVGVAFEDKENPQHTQAAILSITEVPGTQVVFNDYVGEEGFEAAARFVLTKGLPEIVLKEPKKVQQRNLNDTLKLIEEKNKEK